jgi:hypothetical protein
MREFIQVAGVRRWHGDELIALQTETLLPLQKFFGEFGNCVLSGGKVIWNSPNFTLEETVFVCKHADGFKIAKIAPVNFGVSPIYPMYLSITKNVVNKVYDDLNVKLAENNYSATISNVQPGAGLFITIPNGNGVARWQDLAIKKDAWHNVGAIGEPIFTSGFNNGYPNSVLSEQLRFRKDVMGNVELQGAIDFDPLANNGTANVNIAITTLPIGYRPVRDVSTTIPVGYNGTGLFYINILVQTTGVVYGRVITIPAGAVLANLGSGTPYGERFELSFNTN